MGGAVGRRPAHESPPLGGAAGRQPRAELPIGICTIGIDPVLADGRPSWPRPATREAWPPTIQATALPGHATVAPPWDQPTIRPAGNRHARQPPTRDNHQQPLQEVRHPPTAGSRHNLPPETHYRPTAGRHRNLHPEIRQCSAPGNRHQEPWQVHRRGRHQVRRRRRARRRKRKS